MLKLRVVFFIIIFFSKEVVVYAQNLDSSYIKGKAQFEIGNYTKALEYFNVVVSAQKGYTNVNYLIGMAHYNLKEFRQAKKYFKRETKLNPKNSNAFLFKAKSKENMGKYKSALKDLKCAERIDSTNVLVLLEKSNVYYQQKKYIKAIASYLHVNQLSPKTELVYYKLGFCEYHLNHIEKACYYWSKLEDIDDFENYEVIIKTCNISH